MHGGLICLAFCLFGTWPKITWPKFTGHGFNVALMTLMATVDCNSWVKSISHVIWQVCSLQHQVAFLTPFLHEFPHRILSHPYRKKNNWVLSIKLDRGLRNMILAHTHKPTALTAFFRAGSLVYCWRLNWNDGLVANFTAPISILGGVCPITNSGMSITFLRNCFIKLKLEEPTDPELSKTRATSAAPHSVERKHIYKINPHSRHGPEFLLPQSQIRWQS